ncbi:NAD-dependent epimerase/dehydratase family protein [Mesorhizobium caraganae]|uniref:NAD-dependent epimerase/dehydratase family protein n=1 Tax=Mesorhizobium caraganae TaxID=483206 RepID=UPI00193A8156|nr:NAD-dependent epimerase/dehydratase family protein [Mesorhizobium caraganae]MBM2711148.1 NAD-dependent epimerase/dehydratase family protein [Mesorhizobium caraganae]
MIGIFGASGFIGRNLVDHFNQKNIPFRGFVRRAAFAQTANMTLIDFDDPATYRDHLKELSAVVLLVSASVPATFANDLVSEVSRNVVPHIKFLQSIRGTSIEHVVYLSSGGTIYGVPRQSSITEEHPTLPISTYGCGKLMIESAIKTLSAGAGWNYSILRASNPIGKYQSPEKGQGLVAAAVRAAFLGAPIDIWGDGKALRDYIDVRDLCAAIDIVLRPQERKRQIYNVGLGRSVSVNEIVDLCSYACGKPIFRNYIPEKSFLVRDVELNCDAITRDTGWKAKFDISDAIQNFVLDYKETTQTASLP